ncbi:glycine/sarcosine N-methyltransferase [Streptomyces umbrinus]|uniref:Glycine/sarcosine N-methyltransferase n=1 Tax=Streptomyces umbrinus TaxID=67370 RepID=A0ABU0SY71_9ACTN|nr:class I SAM-dependent methyltransferase [Streptomyces umbrinus]MDQ1028502.1 glycine/sarcosine N-methyltransferase [Streptomyces umbrinus]
MPQDPSVAGFYDRLAPDYHLIFPDWDASMARQGRALDALIRTHRATPHAVEALDILDCSCGIGTQAIPLARHGHRVTATDISPAAVARAAREAVARGARLSMAVADMRSLPFADARFDVVVCADNSLPHLLTEDYVHRALREMRRVLRPTGLLVLSTRPYDEIRRDRPTSTPPQLGPAAPHTRTVTFQLWHWHDDGERYDLEHFQLVPEEAPEEAPKEAPEGSSTSGQEGENWDVRVRRTTYWALTQRQLTGFATVAGFTEPAWHTPEETGFFQPVLTAGTTGMGASDLPSP